jgi:gliding motility-associated-like protein
MYRSILLALSLLFFIITAKAAVFVVTSNADSGPGTLREALTLAAANGSAEKDYINFNLPDVSEAGRTIQLFSQLPSVTSNLSIDGSTQTGSKFGTSDAVVKIVTPVTNDAIAVFGGTSVDNVNIFGLYIYDYSSTGTIWADLKMRAAIQIERGSNITIGAANKGNLISGFNWKTIYLTFVNGVTLQDNAVGVVFPGEERMSAGIDMINCKSIIIGGNTLQGNVLLIPVYITFEQNQSDKLTIQSNNIGVLKDGVTPSYSPVIAFGIYTYGTNGVPEDKSKAASITMDISNNLAASNDNVFGLTAIKGTINFSNNYMGIARDGITRLNFSHFTTYEGTPLGMSYCDAQVNVGGDDDSKKNFFAYSAGAVGATGSPNVFIRNNEYQCLVFKGGYGTDATTLPQVKINKVTASAGKTVLTGTATPLAIVDIYSTESCQYSQCSIRKHIQNVTADANGNWQSDINLAGVFYVSATLNNKTSIFKSFDIDAKNIAINHLRCNSTATISGLQVPDGLGYYWIDESGKLVSKNLVLETDKPGKYQLVIDGGCITSDWFEILDNRLQIYDTGIKTTDISCGIANGSIKGLTIYDPEDRVKTTTWTNQSGKVVGNTVDIDHLTAGTYLLTVLTTDGCSKTYGIVILKNTTGPNIDETKKIITPNQCGKLLGSVTNLTVTGTGTLHYSWRDDENQEVATIKDLTGQPGGKYTLHVTDDTQCGEVVSSAFEIKTDGAIILDESAKIIQPATCEFNNGGIKGITATGATIYNWYNSDNQVVSDKPDLDNAAPGSYYLVASNANGCSAQSTAFTIERTPRTIIGNTKVIKNATCGENNGSITIIFQQQPAPKPKSFRWVNHSTGANVATTTDPELKGLDAATYDIYVTEQGGCEYLLASYTVSRDVGLSVIVDNVQVEDDHCQVGTGSIKGINANGTTPLTFVWTDNNNKTVGNAPNLENLNSGTYHIQITDGSGCTQGLVYTVYDKSEVVVPPSVTDLDLCTAGNALLVVNNAAGEYSYRLYDNADSATPLNEQQSGRFAVNVTGDRSYYVSKLKGNCESTRAEIKVKVGISTLNIANTFSPNNDGQNDYWKINGIESYPQAVVQIFNRNGQKLFESKGYGTPFNGTYKGKPLPTGTYFYIINLNKNCNLLSGSLTILR